MRSIFETCTPRAEVLSGELREEIFAARLHDVIKGVAEDVYQDPVRFFDNTYPTEGLRSLLKEALGRLTSRGMGNNAIIRLETAFGGGKTHNLIALYHAARGQLPPETGLVEPGLIPAPNSVRIAGVVGADLDPILGTSHDDATTYTLWGELAYQLGGRAGYEWVAESERTKTAPGTGLLERIIGDTPALIMIDEIARHLRSAKTIPAASGRSDLAEQTSAFLMSLFEFAASKENVVVVFTLADTVDAFSGESEEFKQKIEQVLAEIRRLSARQERVITPSAENEIAAIVCYRLFRSIDKQAAEETAQAYVDYYEDALSKNADLPQRATRAEYRQEIVNNYPFHPELLLTLNRKTSTIPNFHRTRGALRLLAMVIRDLWQRQPAGTTLIHPHHINLAIEDIAAELTSRLERPRFKQVIEADIASPLQGSKAHAQLLDEALAGEPLTQRAATTVFLHSIVQGGASGVDPTELTLAVVRPGDDPALVAKAADKLVDKGWFIEYDGRRYRFKTEPSINKIVTEEMGAVGQVKAKLELDTRIRQVWKKGYFDPVYFPSEPAKVDDDANLPRLVIMHYDAANTSATDSAPPELVMRIFSRKGTQEAFREYKNNLVFLVADRDQIENMVSISQRYLAIQRITSDPQRMGEFYEEQRAKLTNLAKSVELEVRIAITKAYRWLYYPSDDAPVAHANLGRVQLPAQDQGEVNQDQSKVVLGILKNLQKVLTQEDNTLPAQFVKSRAWNRDQTEITTEALRQAFAKKMNLRMLLDVNQLKSTIRHGIEQGVWVYYDSREQVGYDKRSPLPAIQISDETVLYTPEVYAAKGWPIKGVVANPPPSDPTAIPPLPRPFPGFGGGVATPTTPVRPRLEGQGAPAQALQGILDACADARVDCIASLAVTVEGDDKQAATEIRSLGLAIPQLGRADFWIEQEVTAEFSQGESLSLQFAGSWDRYKRIKSVTDGFASEPSLKLHARSTLTIRFPNGLNLRDNQFSTIVDVFTTLGFGDMHVVAEPYEAEKV